LIAATLCNDLLFFTRSNRRQAAAGNDFKRKADLQKICASDDELKMDLMGSGMKSFILKKIKK
jgi:hypothetical protein